MATGECPFCASQVEEPLVIYGGTCPRCFGEIPGEEAPTDPGEEVKAAQHRADAARARRRALIPIAISLPVVGGLAAAAAMMLLMPQKELELLDFDAGEFYMPDLDMLVAQAETQTASETGDAEVEVADAVKTTAASTATGTSSTDAARPGLSGLSLRGTSDSVDVASLGGTDTPGVRSTRRARTSGDDLGPTSLGPASGPVTGAMSSSAPDISFDGPAVATGDRVLSDRNEIREAIQRVMRMRVPQLTTCYERRLNTDPTLQGRWALNFVVKADGSVGRPEAVGAAQRDELLESCIVGQLERWRFPRISAPQPVKKTVTFQPR